MNFIWLLVHKFHFYSIFKSNPMENFVEKIIGVSEGLAGENLAIAAVARKAYDAHTQQVCLL